MRDTPEDPSPEPEPTPKKKTVRRPSAKKKAAREPAAEKKATRQAASPRKDPARKAAAKQSSEKKTEPVELEAEPYVASSETGRVVDAEPAGGAEAPNPPDGEQQPEPAGNSAWNMACHLSTLVTFVTPLGNVGGILAPVLIWQTVGKDDARIEEHAKEAFNFQVNVLFWFVLGSILTLTCILAPIGVPLVLGSTVANVVLTVVAAIKSANGEDYKYPWVYRVLEHRPPAQAV